MSAVLAAALFLSLTLPAMAQTETVPAEIPGETVPAETIPQETVPEPATPAETLPPETVPETTAPAETLPEETIPAETIQQETVPETTAPAETLPEETIPAETIQQETVPETTAPEETIPEETLPEEKPVQVLSVSQAYAMAPGTEGITVRGTVVYADGCQAVLQDETGGIRLYFDADPATMPGEILQVTGCRTGGLAVEDFESLGMGALPLAESTLADAPESLRVQVTALLEEGPRLTRGDLSLKLSGDVTQPIGSWVKARGVILDGIFYADSLTLTEMPREEQKTEADTGELRPFFGQLHAHTGLGDTATPEEAYALAAEQGMDFFAVTVHSDSLDNAQLGSVNIDGSLNSRDWAEGKAAAEAASTERFLALFAYEMSWSEEKAFGHINTFFTLGWQSWTQPVYEKKPEAYFETLASVPGGVSMFCHPGHAYGSFYRFSRYDPAYDRVMHLMELGTGEDALEYYNLALTNGWHLAPALGKEGNGGRTVVLANALTEEGLSEAIRNYRVYATEDPDLEVDFSVNGRPMGSTLGLSEKLEATLRLADPTDAGPVTVALMTEAGTVAQWTLEGSSLRVELPVGHDWYYLKLTQADGDVAVTAPVWVDQYEDMGIRSFTAGSTQLTQGEETLLTLTLFNDERVDFRLDSLEIFREGVSLKREENVGIVYGGGTAEYKLPLTEEVCGNVSITAKVTGTVEGQSREYEAQLTLYVHKKELALCSIGDVRRGVPGESYRIMGYVTAGNRNPYIRFANTLYLQDDTGGIAVEGPFWDVLQTGEHLEVTGVLRNREGCLLLELTEYARTGKLGYRYEPKALSNSAAMDYAAHGGELLQIEGKVVSLEKTSDGNGISRLTIEDVRGDLATAVIDPEISSGGHGTNLLASQIKKGRTVRIIGLLHIDEGGTPILRVRNCDEVIYVPARTDPSNPQTGDSLWFWLYRLLERFF